MKQAISDIATYTNLDMDAVLAEFDGRIGKYADPVEGERLNLSAEEAEAVAAEDPGLLWVELDNVEHCITIGFMGSNTPTITEAADEAVNTYIHTYASEKGMSAEEVHQAGPDGLINAWSDELTDVDALLLRAHWDNFEA